MVLVDGIGCWSWVAGDGRSHVGRPALFLDRDGVIVEDTHFLASPQHVVLLPGAAESIAAFNRARVPVIVVTNQSGVARGYYGWHEFEAVEQEIARQLSEAAGARLDAVFACGYHEVGTGPLSVPNHPWRKPNTGMLLAAAEDVGVCLASSWMAGDRATDLEAARAAGLAGGIYLRTGQADDAQRLAAGALGRASFSVKTAADLHGAETVLHRLVAAPC